MNLETFHILNNDKSCLEIKNRFNYDLIFKCIENTNNLSNNCLIHFNNTAQDILHNFFNMLFNNNKQIILNNNYINSNTHTQNLYIIQNDFIENNIELIINNNSYNFYSLVYLSNINIQNNVLNINTQNNVLSISKIKLNFDYFKNKIVNNGIIIFDNINFYDHYTFFDNYIRKFNYVVFLKTCNKIAYIKKINSVHICSFPKTGTSSFFYNLRNNYIITHNHSLLKLKYILSESNNLILVGMRNPFDICISHFFQNYNVDFNDDVEIKKNNYIGINNYCTNNLENHSLEHIIYLFETNYNFNLYNDWLEEFLELIQININTFNFDIEKGYSFYNYNNNIILIYTLEKLNSNILKLCDYFNIKEFKNYNESETKIYKEIYNNFKNNYKFKESIKNTIFNKNIFSKFYSEKDLTKFYNKY
tara:strand:+ start:156 stop:1412 length:1257 start_codon:yes stop_codon:yes gene_type:complete